ncbi:hypothetical protein [Haloferax sp. ATB1]|uniref:hypothetical protein n=1 Tax=Haloferax sp. ATB1 TaxID=1508454 RepID=UPI0012FE9DBA|nr:hypothetical protein [Haloferax sp. ATB1]
MSKKPLDGELAPGWPRPRRAVIARRPAVGSRGVLAQSPETARYRDSGGRTGFGL